jgi:hypothetical protein
MAALLVILALLVPAARAPQVDAGFLAFAETPRQPGNLLAREAVIGRSAVGRPITLRQLGDPRWSGELLVFGCVHGEKCGADELEPLTGGCPDPGADILLVPDLDPDGTATEARLAKRVIEAVLPAATIRLDRYSGRLHPKMRARLSTSLVRMARRVRED